jgi:7-carboxy-7-deazaguanine synthase
MPPPPTLKINEMFASVQGEGLRQGEATIFIRLTGCNLKCPFCDTRPARHKGESLSLARIIKEVNMLKQGFPSEWVCLTGGEPLLQDLHELISQLKEQGFKIQIETNATKFQTLPVDWYSISPKPDEYFFCPEYIDTAKEIKLVVSKDLTLAVIQRIKQQFPEKTPLLLQPQSQKNWSKRKGILLLRESLQTGLKNIRLSVQLHKI